MSTTLAFILHLSLCRFCRRLLRWSFFGTTRACFTSKQLSYIHIRILNELAADKILFLRNIIFIQWVKSCTESFHFYHVCISNFNWLMWWSFFDVSSLLFWVFCFARSASQRGCAREMEGEFREHKVTAALTISVDTFGKGKERWNSVV